MKKEVGFLVTLMSCCIVMSWVAILGYLLYAGGKKPLSLDFLPEKNKPHFTEASIS